MAYTFEDDNVDVLLNSKRKVRVGINSKYRSSGRIMASQCLFVNQLTQYKVKNC